MTRIPMALAATFLAILFMTPVIASADNKAEATALFKQGNNLRKQGRYASALFKYRAAYKLLPSFKIEYNIALTLEKVGRNAEAVGAYLRFLKAGADKSPPKMLKRAKKKLRRLIQKVAAVNVACEVVSADVVVDGKEYGRTPLSGYLYLEPGKHLIKVVKVGHEPFSKELKLRRGKRMTVRVMLKVKKPETPAPAVAKPQATPPVKRPDPTAVSPQSKATTSEPATETVPPPAAPPEDSDKLETPRRKGRLYTWIAAGTAGALAVAGLAVTIHTGSEFSDLEDACKPNCSDDQVDPLRTEATASYVLFGLAGATAVTSMVLFFLEGRAEQGDPDSTSRRTVRVAPMVGGSIYGLQGQITF